MEAPVWSFGAVTNTLYLMHDFVISNSGTDTLEIKRVVSGCDSCMAIVMAADAIAPGGSTVAHCRLDVRQVKGVIARVVTITSSDPVTPVTRLELNANVVPVYRVFPPEVTLGGAEGERTSTVVVEPLKTLSAPLLLAECDNTNVVVDVYEEPAGRFHVRAQATRTLPRGRSVFGIEVRSENTNDLPCRIVGRIEYPDDYTVMPERLTFEAKDELQTRILWLRQQGEMVFSLQDAVPATGEFHCEIEADPTSADYRIYVEARQLSALKGKSSRVTLKGVTRQALAVDVPVEIMIK